MLALAKAEIAYDPNLADTGDVDMEGSDGDFYDGDDGGEYDDDEYNDDEDTSWKVRRAACLLVVALVAAYPEHSAVLYSQCRPTLQSRFKEREESVKLDVFVAYSALVRQRGATASEEERKRLAVDATEDTSALVKQLRATRSAKLKVCGSSAIAVVHTQRLYVLVCIEMALIARVVCRRVCLRCFKRCWRLQQKVDSMAARLWACARTCCLTAAPRTCSRSKCCGL